MYWILPGTYTHVSDDTNVRENKSVRENTGNFAKAQGILFAEVNLLIP